MAQPATGVALAFGIGAAMTVIIAWPVVTHPSQLIFGDEIVGRHYDAYPSCNRWRAARPPARMCSR